MLAKLGVLALIPLVLLIGLALTTDTAFVDVRTDDVHFFAPVPMVVAKAALHFVPQEETEIHCPELWRYREPISRVVDELRNAPDGVLVEVNERDEFVRITKVGAKLHVEVRSDNESVDVQIPLKAAQRFMARLDGPTFQVSDLLGSVTNTMNGEVVHVAAEDAEVRVWVW